MPADLILPLSMMMGLAACGLIAKWYVMPALAAQPRTRAMLPRCFRFIGLAFLVPALHRGPWIRSPSIPLPTAIY